MQRLGSGYSSVDERIFGFRKMFHSRNCHCVNAECINGKLLYLCSFLLDVHLLRLCLLCSYCSICNQLVSGHAYMRELTHEAESGIHHFVCIAYMNCAWDSVSIFRSHLRYSETVAGAHRSCFTESGLFSQYRPVRFCNS